MSVPAAAALLFNSMRSIHPSSIIARSDRHRFSSLYESGFSQRATVNSAFMCSTSMSTFLQSLPIDVIKLLTSIEIQHPATIFQASRHDRNRHSRP